MDILTKTMYANIGKLITSSLDIDEVLEGVMKEIKCFFNPEHWSLLRLDHNTNELYFLFMEGVKINLLEEFRLKPGEGIAGTVSKTSKSIFVPDVSKDERFSDRVDKLIDFKTKSIVAVPMIYRKKVYGVIEIVNSVNSRNFKEEDHLILSTIADFTAIALANSSLHNRIVEQTNHDSLTGLYNRKKLNTLIEEWSNIGHPVRRYTDSESMIKVVYMDINDFKDINDIYGHREGDKALMSIAEKLNDIFRNDDMIFRIGGDEFLAIIKIYQNDNSEALEERIEESLDNLKYTTKDKKSKATLSYGIASGHIYQIEELMNEADEKMYELKNKKKK